MKQIIARDLRPGIKQTLSIVKKIDNSMLISPLSSGIAGLQKPNHVILPTMHDAHNHPAIYGFLKAANTVLLGESTDKSRIFQLIKERAKLDLGPIICLGYHMEAEVTASELNSLNLNRPIFLLGTSYHAGVIDSLSLKKGMDLLNDKKKKNMIGEYSYNGRVSEDYFYYMMDRIQQSFIEKGMFELLVKGVYDWVMDRISEGTTSITERMLFTKSDWRILKEARRRLIKALGYSPISAVYMSYPIYRDELKKYSMELKNEGIEYGIKIIGDGGTTSGTASLSAYSYGDGINDNKINNKGLPPTMPFNYKDSKAVYAFIQELHEANIKKISFHAIGDNTIDIALSLAPILLKEGLKLTICHFEVPTIPQIQRAAELGIHIDMEAAYSSEAFRYPKTLKSLEKFNNPLGTVLNVYSNADISNLFSIGSDGMPSDLLTIGLGCSLGHPYEPHRLTIEQYLTHTMERVQNGFVLMNMKTWDKITSMKDPEILSQYSNDVYASSAELQKGVTAVVLNGKIIRKGNEFLFLR